MSDAAKNTGTIDRTADKTGGAVRVIQLTETTKLGQSKTEG